MVTDYIYFVYAAEVNRVKIGRAIKPFERMWGIKTNSPCEVTLLGVIVGDREKEKQLHRRFKYLWSHNEWFVYGDEIREYVRTNARPYDPAALEGGLTDYLDSLELL